MKDLEAYSVINDKQGLRRTLKKENQVRQEQKRLSFANQKGGIFLSLCPGNVLKIFSQECGYSSALTGPLKCPFKIFDDACNLSGVDLICRTVILLLLQTIFLCGPVLICFMDVLIMESKSTEETIRMLGDHLLDSQATRVNDDVRLELTFEIN